MRSSWALRIWPVGCGTEVPDSAFGLAKSVVVKARASVVMVTGDDSVGEAPLGKFYAA